MQPFTDPAVEAVFSGYPDHVQPRILELRAAILDVASDLQQVGALDESLKWGEPAYRPRGRRVGTTVRIDWKPATPDRCALYVSCQTPLIEIASELFPGAFAGIEGRRAVQIALDEPVPTEALRTCIALALTSGAEGQETTGGVSVDASQVGVAVLVPPEIRTLSVKSRLEAPNIDFCAAP